jgi:hypothetical protein
MGIPRFQPQTGHGLQNPRQVDLTATRLWQAIDRSPSAKKEVYEIIQPSAILDPGIKEPTAGTGEGGGASEHCRSNLVPWHHRGIARQRPSACNTRPVSSHG